MTCPHGLFYFMTYLEKLQDPRWQKKRLEVMQRDNFTCVCCGDKETTLQIHHKFYLKNTNPWDYRLEVFQTLCRVCHNKQEFHKDMLNEFIQCLLVQNEDYASILNLILIGLVTKENSSNEAIK